MSTECDILREGAKKEFFFAINIAEEKRAATHLDEGWKRLSRAANDRIRIRRRRSQIILLSASAAAVLLIVGISLFFDFTVINQGDRTDESGDLISVHGRELRDVTLYCRGEQIVATSDQPIIRHSDGTIFMDNIEVKMTAPFLKNKNYNTIVVPKGKQAVVILSDGSKLIINARTTVKYPDTFDTTTREVYVDGEAYLDVVSNENSPFVVKTEKFEVEVLGTIFAISSYSNQPESTVALVEGSVNVVLNDKPVLLFPNQLVSIVDGDISNPRHVNLKSLLSWKDGLIHLNSTPIHAVLDRLSFHYDTHFEYSSTFLSNVKVSGKLDISSSDLSSVLNYLSQIAPVQFTRYSDKIIISSR